MNENGNISPVLYITSNKISDQDGEILLEANSPHIFYGWVIGIFERNNSFSLTFYSNNGVNVTDGPILIWDRDLGTFKRYVVDKSQR